MSRSNSSKVNINVSSIKYKILKNSDLFLEFSTLLIALQAVGISSELIFTGTINHKQGDWLTIEAKHLDYALDFH